MKKIASSSAGGEPTASQSTIAHCFKQIDEYGRDTGAKRALLVLMTPGRVIEKG